MVVAVVLIGVEVIEAKVHRHYKGSVSQSKCKEIVPEAPLSRVMHNLDFDNLEKAASEINDAEGHEPLSDWNTAANWLVMNAQAEHDEDDSHEDHVQCELSVDCVLLFLVDG